MALVASFDWLKKLGLKADFGGMNRSFYDRGEFPNRALASSYCLSRGKLYVALCKSEV